MIGISVVIPTYNRPAELRACLAGFAAQTVPREVFEVVVVDDGSTESMEPLVLEFEPSLNVVFRRIANSGPSVARNMGIECARAPLLVLYDDDLCPRPGLIEYCLRFHESWPQQGHTALLWFRLDPRLRNQTLLHWAFPRMYPFPAAPGVYDWQTFWSGTLTCKKSIFGFGHFSQDFRFLEDAELALRLNRRLDLRVHFERRPMGLFTRGLTLARFLARSYNAGYYGYRLARKYPGAWGDSLLFEPEMALVPAQELQGMMAAARGLLASAPAADSPAYRMFSALCLRAETHAYSEGWLNARAGGQPEPPGMLARFLPAETPACVEASCDAGPEIAPPSTRRSEGGC